MSSAEVGVVPGRSVNRLTDQAIEDILDSVPNLRARPRRLERLHGGLTNLNVKLTLPDGTVAVARISTSDSALLAIDRSAEHANSVAAAAAGAAPDVLAYAPEAGVLVVRWIEGRTLGRQDVGRQLPRIAAACRTLHAGPRFTGEFDMFEVQRRYLRLVTEHGFRLPGGYAELMPALERVRRALAVRTGRTVPCHNDLLAENIVDSGDRLWLIDYEYAGNNDPCFELGNVWSEAALEPGQLEELVEAYDGRLSRSRVARARLFGLASAYGWTLWGCIQQASSSLDFDFWGWGQEKYERAVAEFAGPALERLLEEVTAAD